MSNSSAARPPASPPPRKRTVAAAHIIATAGLCPATPPPDAPLAIAAGATTGAPRSSQRKVVGHGGGGCGRGGAVHARRQGPERRLRGKAWAGCRHNSRENSDVARKRHTQHVGAEGPCLAFAARECHVTSTHHPHSHRNAPQPPHSQTHARPRMQTQGLEQRAKSVIPLHLQSRFVVVLRRQPWPLCTTASCILRVQ